MFYNQLHMQVSFESILEVFNRYCDGKQDVRIETAKTDDAMKMTIHRTYDGKDYEVLEVMFLNIRKGVALINGIVYKSHNEFYATLFTALENLNLKND